MTDKPSNRTEIQAAAGYVNAAVVSLGVARRRLPDDHFAAKKLAQLIAQVEQLHEELA